MFDVIHVLYEEDITPTWEKHIDVKDRVREAIYSLLYDSEYKFSSTKSDEPVDYSEDDDGPSGTLPAGPPVGDTDSAREVKPFIPVSSEADLMKVLDSPMN